MIEPRNRHLVQGVDAFCFVEGKTAGGVIRELLVGPARSEIPGTYDRLHAREPGDPVVARWCRQMLRPGWFAEWWIGAGGPRGER